MEVTDHGDALAITYADAGEFAAVRAVAALAIRRGVRVNLLRAEPGSRSCEASILENFAVRTARGCQAHESAAAALEDAMRAARRGLETQE